LRLAHETLSERLLLWSFSMSLWLKVSQKLGLKTNVKIRQELKTQLLAERRRAAEKMADRNYWRNVGDLEMEAALDIEVTIAGIPEHLSCNEYQEQLARALEKLADQWRANGNDEDGYGVATVHAVGRLLPSYCG
jgi:hypothetical protein